MEKRNVRKEIFKRIIEHKKKREKEGKHYEKINNSRIKRKRIENTYIL